MAAVKTKSERLISVAAVAVVVVVERTCCIVLGFVFRGFHELEDTTLSSDLIRQP